MTRRGGSSLHAAGVVALVWLAEVTLDGPVLVAALAGGAALLAVVARLDDSRAAERPASRRGGAARGRPRARARFEAPLRWRCSTAARTSRRGDIALVACAVAALALAQAAPPEARPAAAALAAVVLLHLASVAPRHRRRARASARRCC